MNRFDCGGKDRAVAEAGCGVVCAGWLNDWLMQGKTSIVIAYRLSTVRDADTIFVIDAGVGALPRAI